MKTGYKIYKMIVIISTIITVFVSILVDKGYGYEYISYHMQKNPFLL